MKTITLIKITVMLLFILPQPAFSAGGSNNRIELLKPTVYPDTTENHELINNLITGASVLTERIYSNYVEMSESSENNNPGEGYSLALNYVFDPGGSVLQITLSDNNSTASNTLNIMGTISYDTPLFLARTIFSLWASHNNFLSGLTEPPPLFVEDLSTSYIQQTVMPEMPTVLMPMDLAVKPNGNLLGAFSMICVEFDTNFKILGQPGRSLFEEGSYTSAAGLGLTPGGTVYLKPSMGRDIYRFSSNSEIGEKWRTGMDLYGPFTILPDGSIIVIDIQKKKALKIFNRVKSELNLFTSPYSYIAAIATGPEGNIWVYDISEQRIRIHTPGGEIIDSIIPIIDTSAGLSPSALSVYKDGRFVVYYSTGEMHSFTREGIPIWGISEINTLDGVESLPQSAKIALDNKNGLIYIADMMGQRIIKLQDRSYINSNQIYDLNTKILVELNDKYLQTNNVSHIASKAEMYEKADALELANQTWERILDIDPDYDPAYDKLDEIEVKIMSLIAESMKIKTIEKLDLLGPESARSDYRRTIQLYEQILAIDPSNSKIKNSRFYLEKLFGMGGQKIYEAPPFEIKSLTVANLFPSLMQYYQHSPVGSIKIKNTGSEEIKNLKVSLFIKQFMDYPVFSEKIPTINPMETRDLDLDLLFNQDVLKLEEDLKIQVKLEISGTYMNKILNTEEIVIVTLYRRSAMQWDDSGKLSSFITPNESVVEQFSHRVVSNNPIEYNFNFTEKFNRAIRIINSLGAYGISYIEDPASPITKILGDSEAVDTVRFARKTLFIRSGDCDDTTALLASLLESSGIETAIMTSPGHVFMAFNSEESISNRWMYETEKVTAIPYKGTLWIPVETTILKDGFFKAWQIASQEVKKYDKKGKIEFIPLNDQRSTYPPLPLGESIYQVLEPDNDIINLFDIRSTEIIRTDLYSNLVTNLQKESEIASARRKSALQNRLGILHVRFENYYEAEKIFQEINKEQPEYISAYVNLANLYRLQGKNNYAINLLESALEESPDSTAVNLVLSQCYFEELDFVKAGNLFVKVKTQAPELALKFSYLSSPKDGRDTIVRAAGAGETPQVFWDSEN
jgi:tetratricopeptide (TPR) repeat protein